MCDVWWPWKSRLMHTALIPNDLVQYTTDLIPGTQYTIHNTGNTWCQRFIAEQSQYLAHNAASTQSQYLVRITRGLVTNTHRVQDLIPNT